MSAKPSLSVPPDPAPQAAAAGARIAAAPDIAGDAGSPQAMERLQAAIAELRTLSVEPYLRQSAAALMADRHQEGAEWAIKALERDERCGMGWYCLAIAREKAGDFKGSLQCYESALALSPDHVEIANNLGRLAFRMGMNELAEQFFRLYLRRYPNSFEASNNLACCLRDQQRYAEAVDVLRGAIAANVDNPILWNTLGTVLTDQGEFAQSITFFNEALRLDPDFVKALYNRSTAKLSLGDPTGATPSPTPSTRATPDP